MLSCPSAAACPRRRGSARSSSGPLLRRLDSEDRALLHVRQHIQQPIRPLPDIADTLAQIDEQRLAPHLFHLLVEHDPLDVPRTWNLSRPEAAYEHVAL